MRGRPAPGAGAEIVRTSPHPPTPSPLRGARGSQTVEPTPSPLRGARGSQNGTSAILIFVFSLFFVSAALADPPAGLLRLANGDRVEGTLRSISDDNIDWKHPHFDSPFTWPRQAVASITYPTGEDQQTPSGEWIIRLQNDDFIYGNLQSWENNVLSLQSDWGSIQLPGNLLRSAERLGDDSGIIFSGSGELAAWNDLATRQQIPRQWANHPPTRPMNSPDDWSAGQGLLASQVPGAALCHFLKLPDQYKIAVTLTWDGTPNFELGWGYLKTTVVNNRLGLRNVPVRGKGERPPLRIEVWDQEIVAVWELKETANVVSLASWPRCGGELSVEVEVDAVAGIAKFEVLGGASRTLTLDVSAAKDTASAAVQLINHSGQVALQNLTLRPAVRSTAVPDPPAKADRFVMMSGEVRQIDVAAQRVQSAEVREIVQQTEVSQPAIDLQQVRRIDFAARESLQPSSTTRLSQSHRILFHDGSRIQGSMLRMDRKELSLELVDGLTPLPIDLTSVSRVLMPSGQVPQNDPRDGRLESDETRVAGRFIDTKEPNRPLWFQPVGATAAAMGDRFAGRYLGAQSLDGDRDSQGLLRLTPPKPVRPPQRQPRGMMDLLSRAFLRQGGTSLPKMAGQIVYLRDGDAFQARVTAITESEVGIDSAWTAAKRLPATAVATMQLASQDSIANLDEVLKQRLLTVPRQQRKTPPTDLVIARNGDLLRCKVIAMDDQTLRVESRLETIEIPRDVVSQIIRLPLPGEDAPIDQPAAAGNPLQVVLRDRTILHIDPTSVVDGTIRGNHRLLDDCELSLEEVDVMFIGQQQTIPPPAEQWPLTHAPQPVEPPTGGGGESIAAVVSPLVGQPAPALALKLTNGQPFSIEQHRGHVLVLDFWASWCGPCLQAMPMIDAAVAGFDPAAVQLVAVNLQEDAETIAATLERLKLTIDVAMDIDGVAAGRYQAGAIPQTVVIDPAGTVTHVFIGTSANIGERLREAINQSLRP